MPRSAAKHQGAAVTAPADGAAATERRVARVMIVDDEWNEARVSEMALQAEGFATLIVDKPLEAQAQVEAWRPDLIALDMNLGLPDLNGIELCKRMQAAGCSALFIFVTAYGDLGYKLGGLDLAADYIVKGMNPLEFVARVKAALRGRRPDAASDPAARLRLDLFKGVAHLPDGRAAKVSPQEMALLQALLDGRGEAVPVATLLEKVWGVTGGGAQETNLLNVAIRRLRRKVERDASRPTLVITAQGIGYRLAL